MSVLAEGYSSYMTHFHKFDQRIYTFNTAFNHVYDLSRQGMFIDCDIEERMDQYPKYPCIYRYTNKLGDYNLLGIHHAALDTVDSLIDYITSKNALEIKPLLDSVPTDLTKIENDVYLQYTFFSDIDELFRLRQNFHDYSYLKKHINYSNALSDPMYNEDHSDYSFLHLFLFDFIFRQQLKNNVNFTNAMNVYCLNNDVFNRQSIIDEFDTFLKDNQNDLLRNVVNIIIQSLYKMSNTDDDLINDIVNKIEGNIDVLKTAFETFVNQSTSLPSTEVIHYSLNSLYLVFGSNVINDIFNDETIFDQFHIQTLAEEENRIFKNFIDQVSSTNAKSYLYLSYLYKFWPIKFLNIYPIIMDKYIVDVIKPESTYAYSQRQIDTLLKNLISIGNLNYNNLADYFQNNIDHTYLHDLCVNEKVVEFGTFIYFIKLIDDFMESTVYQDFVDGLYNDVFIILRDKGYVDHNFNWCRCKALFNLFFKAFIRSNISERTIFTNINDEFKTAFLNIISKNTGDPLYDVDINYQDQTQFEFVSRLTSLYNSMVISHFDKLHGFIESMFLSKVSDMVNYRMLSYFLVDQP